MKMKLFRRVLAFVLSVVLCGSVINVEAFAAEVKTNTETNDDQFEVNYSVVNSWDASKQVQVDITNTGNDTIEQWALKYELDGEISQIWNAVVYDSEKGIITNADYNADIYPGQTVTFGYIINNNEKTPTTFEMVQQRVLKEDGYEVEFYPDIYYGQGLNGTVLIKNTTDTPIKNWNLEVDASFEISSVWLADILDRKDNHYVFAGNSNTIIPAFGTVSFGLCGTYEELTELNNIQLSEIIITDGNIQDINDTEEQGGISWDEMEDSDKDGLPNVYELENGLDLNNPDTDGDGLTDGFEVMKASSNPLDKYTMGNGILDADLDPDEDGLTMLQEYIYNTNPLEADTDGDGLLDGEEINVYGTDPNVADTDNDEVNDALEIQVGLDPLNPQTFGYPDKEFKLAATFNADSNKLSKINKDNEDFQMSFTMEGTGDLASDVYIRKSAYADAIDSEIVLGVIPEIVYKGSGNLESVTVNFAISDMNIYNNYSSEDLKGAKRYNVFYYDKDDEFLAPLSTTVDESTNTITATAPGAGTFVIIDMEKWFESLGFEITDEYVLPEENSNLGGNELADVESADKITYQRFLYDELKPDGEDETISENAGIQTIDESEIQEKEVTDSSLISGSQSTQTEETVAAPTERMMLMATPAPIPSVITSGATVDLIFCINNNIYNINDTEFESIRDNIKEISREVFASTGHARIYILDQNGNLILTKYSSKYALSDSSIDYMVSQIKNASPTVQNFDKQLETVINDIELRDGSYRSLVFFGDTYLSGQSETHATQLVNLGIKAIIDCPYTQPNSWYDRLSKKSNGLLLYSYLDFAKDMINFMFGDGYYTGLSTYNMITTNSLKKIKLKGVLNSHSLVDTDKDGLSDWNEIKQSKITVDAGGNAILPTYYDYLNNRWFHEYLVWKLQYGKLHDRNGKSLDEMLKSILVLPVISDPTMEDSDGDGMNDPVEFSNTYLDERFKDVGPFHKDTVETLYPELEDQDSGKASYVTVSDNDVVMHLRIVFKGDTDTKATTVLKTTGLNTDQTTEVNNILGRIGSDPTLKELAVDGIKSRWATSFKGNKYDFCEELPVNFSVVIKDDKAEFFKNEITLNIKSGVCGVCHQAGVNWSAGCNRNVTMYTSYCKKHSDKDGSKCSDYAANLYHIAQFAGTAAHEFGHVMGLKDLYRDASVNHGKEIVANTEITYQSGYFALPQAGVIMMNNGCATPNDIEMLIFAYAEDSWQYYVPYGKKQKMSKAIRSSVVFTDGTKNYTWDEANKKFI